MNVIKKIIAFLIITSLFVSEITINAARGGGRGGGRGASMRSGGRSGMSGGRISSRHTSRPQGTRKVASRGGHRGGTGQKGGGRRITDTFGTGKNRSSQGKGRTIKDTFGTGKGSGHNKGRTITDTFGTDKSSHSAGTNWKNDGHDGWRNTGRGGDWWGPGLAAIGLAGLGFGALTQGSTGYSDTPVEQVEPAEEEVAYADVGMETPVQTPEPNDEKIPDLPILPNLGITPPNLSFTPPFPHEPPVPKPITTKTRVVLINTLNKALKDPDFNQDFQQFVKTKFGKLVIQDVFEDEKEAQNLINIVKSGQLQGALSGLTPISGPIGDVMQMTK